ncbi:MAG: hypothetical protein JSC189_001023 [Candidatus Tokpelaia sp. JSC189]|nr:MAG: hypothetical protein JSC189_001023 [Candidatus Tokpelaia sp. JSC189]
MGMGEILTHLDQRIGHLSRLCRYDPVVWGQKAWRWGHGGLRGYDGLRGWQREICSVIGEHLKDEETRYQPLRIAVASGHGIGKSALMGIVSNWAMSCFGGARVLMTANTENQLRTKTSPEVGKWFSLSLTSHWFDVKAMSIKARDRGDIWRLDFVTWSSNHTEAFAGLHNKGRMILLLFDEASNIDDKVWEVAEGALSDEDTVIIWLVFGNPTRNSGRFRECFRKYRHRWVIRHIDSRTVEGTNREHLQRSVEDHGEDSDYVKVRIRGEFPSQSCMQFISLGDVDEARSRHLRAEQYQFAPVILGVDPAWTGEDTFEIMLRQGLYSKSLLSLARNDNDVHMAGVIARLEDEYSADAVFIDMGYGTGIKSAGDVMGRSWRLVSFGGKAIDPGYANKRAEMWGMMKRWLKEGGTIDPCDDILYQDLIAPEMAWRMDGKILLESKRDMKVRGQASPNKADALALSFAFPVGKKLHCASRAHRPGLNDPDYNPWLIEPDYNPFV